MYCRSTAYESKNILPFLADFSLDITIVVVIIIISLWQGTFLLP